jgi:ABC-type bacteriocin/lantibiotic exporter with double-glycine peptidase domain
MKQAAMSIRQVLIAIGQSLQPHRRRIFLALAFILIHTLFGFTLILSTSRFKPDHFPLFLVLLFSLHHLLSVFDDWILTDISARWVQDTRRSCLYHFVSTRKKSGKNSLIDWNELQLEIHWLGESIFSLLRGTFRKLLQLGVFSFALFWLSPTLFLFCGILFLCIILLGTIMGRWVNRIQEEVIIAQSACANFELEAARGMPVIRAYQKGLFFSAIHDRFLGAATSKTILLARLRMISHPIQIVLFLATLLLVYIVGLSQVETGALTQGKFYAFIAGLSLLHAPLSALSQDISTFLSHQEMHYLAEIFSSYAPKEESIVHPPTRKIHCQDLSFEYASGCPIFQPVSFSIQNGQIIGFSGNNGSGKTTLALILAGILPPTHGELVFDPPDSGSGPISFVDQQGTVFTLSLNENFFRPENFPQEQAQRPYAILQHWIEDSAVGQLSPETLSSGQKKMISLERAIQHNHGIFIIDEPENSLDHHNQLILKDLLLRLRDEGKIILICSHASLFLDICDRVIQVAKH